LPYIYYNQKKILFIHVPKTGGTSVEKWLQSFSKLALFNGSIPATSPVTPQHFTFKNISEMYADDYFDYVFTIVRNPFARIESEYRMMWMQAANEGKTAESFASWIDHLPQRLAIDPWYRDNHLRTQAEFIGSSTRIFRYEDGIENAVRQVAMDLDLPEPVAPLGREMTSDKFKGKIAWSANNISVVQRLYAIDFEKFSYDAFSIPA